MSNPFNGDSFLFLTVGRPLWKFSRCLMARRVLSQCFLAVQIDVLSERIRVGSEEILSDALMALIAGGSLSLRLARAGRKSPHDD